MKRVGLRTFSTSGVTYRSLRDSLILVYEVAYSAPDLLQFLVTQTPMLE